MLVFFLLMPFVTFVLLILLIRIVRVEEVGLRSWILFVLGFGYSFEYIYEYVGIHQYKWCINYSLRTWMPNISFNAHSCFSLAYTLKILIFYFNSFSSLNYIYKFVLFCNYLNLYCYFDNIDRSFYSPWLGS